MLGAMRDLLVALTVVALVGSSGAARAQLVAAAGSSGHGGAVDVVSTTEGAEVDIDGNRVGTIPLSGPITTLAPGEHTIKVVKPGFAPYIDVFKLDRRKPTRLEVELVPVAGVLKLKANVEAARVYVDGKFVGEAPLTTEVAVGARSIKVEKGGYRDFLQEIPSVAGQEVNLSVQLEELPMGLNPYKPPPPPPPKWYEKWWVWTVGAVGVAAVVTGVVVPVYYATRDPLGDFCKNNGCQGGTTFVPLMQIPK